MGRLVVWNKIIFLVDSVAKKDGKRLLKMSTRYLIGEYSICRLPKLSRTFCVYEIYFMEIGKHYGTAFLCRKVECYSGRVVTFSSIPWNFIYIIFNIKFKRVMPRDQTGHLSSFYLFTCDAKRKWWLCKITGLKPNISIVSRITNRE